MQHYQLQLNLCFHFKMVSKCWNVSSCFPVMWHISQCCIGLYHWTYNTSISGQILHDILEKINDYFHSFDVMWFFKRTPSYCYCRADGCHGLFHRLIYSLAVSQWNSHAPRLHVELLPADPGGLLVEVLVTFGLLPHVVILNALTDRARSYLVGSKTTVSASVQKNKKPQQNPEHNEQLGNQPGLAVGSLQTLLAWMRWKFFP